MQEKHEEEQEDLMYASGSVFVDNRKDVEDVEQSLIEDNECARDKVDGSNSMCASGSLVWGESKMFGIVEAN